MSWRLSELLKWRGDLPVCSGLVILVLATRIPFTGRLLYHMDSVQFALALDRYDITVHQPHPPGYFLYVMLGRLVRAVVGDDNLALVSISILFSCLSVVVLFLLGKALFDFRTGLTAALFAVTSPLYWFHGEVALSYMAEAFFSVSAAYLCLHIARGRHELAPAAALLFGLAGGVRQNTIVFLLPLLLFTLRKTPLRHLIGAMVMLMISSAAWFIPMVRMTGGWDAYQSAFHELWLFNTGNVSVFERGLKSFEIFGSSLMRFIIYGLGACVFAICPAAYAILRKGRPFGIDKGKALFLLLWVGPAFLFYLLIFIHPANPGYILVFLPALLLLAAASTFKFSEHITKVLGRSPAVPAVISMALINACVFLFSEVPVSFKEINGHGERLESMLEGIKGYKPEKTAVFVGPYIFYGYRQIMYYLPEYFVCQVDIRTAKSGEKRKIFCGRGRRTFLSDGVSLPPGIDTCALPLIAEDEGKVAGIEGITVKTTSPVITVASGPISIMGMVYPGLDLRKSPGPHVARERSEPSAEHAGLMPLTERPAGSQPLERGASKAL